MPFTAYVIPKGLLLLPVGMRSHVNRDFFTSKIVSLIFFLPLLGSIKAGIKDKSTHVMKDCNFKSPDVMCYATPFKGYRAAA